MNTMTLGTTTLATDMSLPPQPRRILAHLEKGKDITGMEAMIVYHITNLKDCIFKIRNAGHSVRTVMKRDEVGGKYAAYTLEQKPKTVTLREAF